MAEVPDLPTIKLDDEFELREIHLDDAKEFLEYYSNPEVSKNILSYIPENLDKARLELSYWKNLSKNGEGVYWAIAKINKSNTTSQKSKMIGTIGLNKWHIKNSRIEISYDLAKEYWGKGITTKAITKIIKFAFKGMGINRIEAYTLPKNIASIKVLEKNGFKKEGVLRSYRYEGGVYYDFCLLSLIRKDYLNLDI